MARKELGKSAAVQKLHQSRYAVVLQCVRNVPSHHFSYSSFPMLYYVPLLTVIFLPRINERSAFTSPTPSDREGQRGGPRETLSRRDAHNYRGLKQEVGKKGGGGGVRRARRALQGLIKFHDAGN